MKLKISQNACSEVVRENSLEVENIPSKVFGGCWAEKYMDLKCSVSDVIVVGCV